MGGGLLQLVAYGAQDVYLTGNPQITFFKVVYRRHTNFAMESIQQTFNGTNNFGSSVSVLITRNGDLINRVYFNAKLLNNQNVSPKPEAADALTDGLALVPYFGQRLLKTIELEIGGQKIDKHYSEWLYIWNELSMSAGKKEGYRAMVGGDMKNRSVYLGPQESYEVYVPLEFWFCRNVGLALPLIALQYHEVKINITYANASDMVDKSATVVSNRVADGLVMNTGTGSYIPEGGTEDDRVDPVDASVSSADNATLTGKDSNLKLSDVSLWVDYIFLDTDERRRFAQLSHEYLIEQLQFTGTENVSSSTSMKSLRMTFNHPCKELVWVVHNDESKCFWNNFSSKDNTAGNIDSAVNPVKLAKLQLNGNDRFAERDGTYFSVVQPYQHHECTPDQYRSGINVYSFALKPEEHQPSGTLNMSRIDTAVLSMSSTINGTVSIFAVNYNVLRIMSGMGGLAYSN